MRLEPRNTEPGLWVNPDYPAGTPGTFAVVIGVSRYAHLADGDQPAAETYGLGQLRVSALTAFRVFRWLAEGYRVDGCPLCMVWLLLAPTPEELAHEPGMAAHLTPPTFDNCRKAIRFWSERMKALPAAAAQESRAFFFWSGHGLEIHQEQQILLPADYLAPPAPALNDAVSTQNLRLGLSSLGVARKFFFIDACRNDHYALKVKKVRGADILNEDEAALVNPAGVAPLLYATTSGQQAFQQPDPARGLSIFGQALLDGFNGRPDIELDCRSGPCSVNVFALQGFVEERVVQLLAAAGAAVVQAVRLGGSSRNEPITYVEHAPAPVTAPTPGTRDAAGAPVAVALVRSARVEKALADPFTVTRAVQPGVESNTWLHDVTLAHVLFGSEHVTAVWSGLRVYALGRRRWIGPEVVELHRIERHDDTRGYRVELSFRDGDPLGHWLQLTDTAGVTHGVVLTGDRRISPRYVVELDVAFGDAGRAITRVEASLSRDNPDPLGEAARIWQRYRTADVGEAVSAYELSVLEKALRDKVESPLGATVASLVLLRADRLDLLHDWLRNLANWFPDYPDGAVLRAEQVLREQKSGLDASIGEAAEFLGTLTDRGLPHTGETLGYAAVLADRLARLGDRVPAASRDRIARLRRRVDTVLSCFSPGGLFTAYTRFDPGLDPLDLIGPVPANPR